jgi:hypothetical protein
VKKMRMRKEREEDGRKGVRGKKGRQMEEKAEEEQRRGERGKSEGES